MIFEPMVLPAVSIRIGGKIKKAIQEYRNKKVPMKVMLTDYLAVMSKGDRLAAADNPWAYNYKGIEGHEVESGVSHEETLFRFSAMGLKNQKPSDVIEAAFYTNRRRNDSAFELGYLTPLFLKETNETDRVLIVNPSPGMICAIEEGGHGRKRYYAVADNTIAKLYSIQFSNAEFCTFDSMNGIEAIDAVLIANRDQKLNAAPLLLESLSCCKDDAKVIGLVPCAWLDNPSSGANRIIEENGLAIRQILLVDSKATASSPRKKMIVFMEKGQTEDIIETFQSSYDENTRLFSVFDDSIQIGSNSYLKSGMTILKCVKSPQGQIEEKVEPKYKKAEEYRFSDEISLFFRLYAGRKNRFAGIAYYREIKDAKQKTWGKKLSADIERGLRADSEEEVVDALEKLVFDDALYPLIREDIKRKYVDTGEKITLKGLWYYCENYYSESKQYDHEYASQLFMKDEIAKILPQVQTGKEIIAIVAKCLNVEREDIPYRVILLINMILKAAAEHNVLRYNPIETFVSDYTRRATVRQQDVRNALVKKHYSPEEEMRIFKAIVKPRRINGRKEFSCTLNSLLLAVAIRLFTGMALREVAALKWGDLVQIEGTQCFYFRITKFVDKNGRIMDHSEKGRWNRFRLVPSAKVLSLLLYERRRFLTDNGIEEEYLKECPIIVKDEGVEKMQELKAINHCKPGIISDYCNEIIKTAGVPENEVILPDDNNDLVTDFNRYHGDIFLSNFRHKANHEACMTMGEINYMIGISAPDTFSHHYADYSNEFLQIGIIQKLSRWESGYEMIVSGKAIEEPSLGTIKGSGTIITGPFKDGNAAVDLIIKKRDSSDVIITAYSTHGIEVEKTEY